MVMNIFSLFKFFWRIFWDGENFMNKKPRPGLNRTWCGKVKYNGASHGLSRIVQTIDLLPQHLSSILINPGPIWLSLGEDRSRACDCFSYYEYQ